MNTSLDMSVTSKRCQDQFNGEKKFH